MNLALPPDLTDFINRQIKAGLYETLEDVIKAGLERLQADTAASLAHLQHLQREVAIGVQQADREEFVTFAAADIIKEGRSILEKKSTAL